MCKSNKRQPTEPDRDTLNGNTNGKKGKKACVFVCVCHIIMSIDFSSLAMWENIYISVSSFAESK